ncbi:MAG: endonuclease III [Phycisphaerales bacterium]|nr:endonuclease III [Phycisphaerales bacterium]
MTAEFTPASSAAQKAEFGFELPRPTAAAKARALALLAELRRNYPNAHCELNYASPHELLVATILSAQATDVSVNKATPALFRAFPSPADYARSSPEQIEPFIRSIGLFRSKARSIHAAMTSLVTSFGGNVPQTMQELLTLRGVARKTAGVVLGNAFNINMNVVVDTHVHRLAQRLSLAPAGATVQQTERWLMALFPRDAWCELSHLLIFHGRYTCKARGVQCCQHPVCSDFSQRCELRVSAKPAKSAASKQPSKPSKPTGGKKRPRKESNL